MLPKEMRISKGKEYSAVYKMGRRLVGQYMIVFLKENRQDGNRFGIVTSKKIGNAVVRNRAKRQIREIIKNNLEKIPDRFDMVVVARFNIKEAGFAVIEKDFLRLMRKASNK